MILNDFRAQFNKTTFVSEEFFSLMKKTFGFYTTLGNDFRSNLGELVEQGKLDPFLQNEIRPRLFDAEYCKTIEATKKQFLAANIKLEQFIEETAFEDDFLNDLNGLKKVSEAIYELLQTHWEFFKYEKKVANNRVLISFLLEIDLVSVGWDTYLEKYLSVSRILALQTSEATKESFKKVEVNYHLPKSTTFTLSMGNDFIQFLQLAFDFMVKIHKLQDENLVLELVSMEIENPVSCMLMVPEVIAESYERFLNYLSVDVLKRDTLVKFVMEVLRLQQVTEVPKASLTPFQKKIAKQLGTLHPEGYFSVNQDEKEDSVSILNRLIVEMEQLKIKFPDLLSGATNRLARDRVPAADPVAEKSAPATATPAKTKPSEKSTVNIDVKKKQHIGYLTS